ncbi:class E sortase [Arthrobacter sp. MYb23]|uniref:class E sortase n=1 Tax=unclassified Arthrobacter TaxID=235627 RepID=UPI000CFC9D13|nr:MULTISPECIES: class E sortase [unclassified Arthrobacter]PRB43809.1 class E sortase [Arthrobacter sp. MYb51]PRB97415.1 class E sortase [Arthrobacter sp. MYb23]
MQGDLVAHQQQTAASAMPSARQGQELRPRKRLRASDVIRKISQILGELLITAGIVLLLFVGWELWWTNVEADAKQTEAVKSFAQEFSGPVTPAAPAAPVDYGPPVVTPAPAYAGMIGIMYIPRFGPDYTRPIIEGTGSDVLDTLGLGHYGSTSMPGAPGNFAVAGHRQTHGAVLDNIHTLVPGDKIYIQTADGYYTYVFRNNQIVLPDRTDVLMPVPTEAGVQPTESILTMTSCNPRFGAQERIIAYSMLDSWQPASAGPPSEIAAQVARAHGKG